MSGRAEVAVRSGIGVCSGCECAGLSSPVLVEREAVDHQRVTEQVQELACVAEAVRQPEMVPLIVADDATVDGLELRGHRQLVHDARNNA